MKRSQLKNIINKSKELSAKGSSFDLFKKSLPINIDDNYRLEAAWEAYGSPKDFKSAVWEGLIQPIDENNYKLPSIGYNKKTDEYEYLNKGLDNEIVNKDIRVWDNDVIPFVKELKQGGFIRIYDEEKDCWKYSKNQSQDTLNELRKVIDSFLKGGKSSRERKYKTYKEFKEYLGPERNSEEDYDLQGAYNDDEVYFDWEDRESKNPGKEHFSDKYKLPNHPTFSTESKYSNSYTLGGQWSLDENGNDVYTTSPYIENRSTLDELRNYFNLYEPGVTLVYKGMSYYPLSKFKSGGQMNVIPAGALHARKNNMEGAGEDFTAKGIPVISNDGEQVAEIERGEILYSKSTTDIIEKAYKEYQNTSDKEELDKISIRIGKFLTKEIIENTLDNINLILEVAEKNNLEYNK